MTADFSFKIMDPAAPLGPKADCTIPGYLTERHYKCNPTKFNNLLMARTVLDAPLLVFEGVREFNEGGWCFVGRPGQYYLREDVMVPLSDGRVFAVYLNPQLILYEWRLEYAQAPATPFPRGHADRYRRLAWQRTF